jgi:hypothetical protein
MSKDSSLTLENNLQVFFFDLLQSINKKSLSPLPNEIIFYASNVMDKFGTTEQYFEESEGKIKEKVLGLKLMESTLLPKNKQKLIVKDIGETALQLCGYFPDSLNKKIIDTKYYHDIGVMAYSRLNSFEPNAYNTPQFFLKFAKNFNQVTTLMSLVSEKQATDPEVFFLMTKPNRAC